MIDPRNAERVRASLELLRTADGSWTLFDPTAGEAFASQSGALTEAVHVYLQNSGIQDRLERGLSSRVLEIGFGAALNFLLTADAALTAPATLDYTALELAPVEGRTLAELGYGRHLQNPQLADSLVRWLEVHQEARRRTVLSREFANRRIRLRLVIADATHWVGTMASQPFDAIYLDAFSPEASRALWEEAFLRQLADRLAPEGRLVTYCVNREVRDAMHRAGLVPERVPGPPAGKREVAIARRAR